MYQSFSCHPQKSFRLARFTLKDWFFVRLRPETEGDGDLGPSTSCVSNGRLMAAILS